MFLFLLARMEDKDEDIDKEGAKEKLSSPSIKCDAKEELDLYSKRQMS